MNKNVLLQVGKRTRRLELHLSEEETEIIRRKAFEAGLPVAVYLRECGLQKTLYSLPSVGEKEKLMRVRRDLGGMCNNLNQVTKQMHQEGFGRNALEIVELINKIDKIISDGY
ncbi:plasmid mobilization protein [Arachidicoccus sp.]|uniref:plasmid mobilization protein n=1 Tax=Arachidicoccus sp. TaxID=1872624 RepID=UPI003D2176A6